MDGREETAGRLRDILAGLEEDDPTYRGQALGQLREMVADLEEGIALNAKFEEALEESNGLWVHKWEWMIQRWDGGQWVEHRRYKSKNEAFSEYQKLPDDRDDRRFRFYATAALEFRGPNTGSRSRED
jgi:hypothetical protein